MQMIIMTTLWPNYSEKSQIVALGSVGNMFKLFLGFTKFYRENKSYKIKDEFFLLKSWPHSAHDVFLFWNGPERTSGVAVTLWRLTRLWPPQEEWGARGERTEPLFFSFSFLLLTLVQLLCRLQL